MFDVKRILVKGNKYNVVIQRVFGCESKWVCTQHVDGMYGSIRVVYDDLDVYHFISECYEEGDIIDYEI